MSYGVLADLVMVVHLAFIVFVMLGGLLALRWRRAAWIHLPTAIWGTLLELGGWSCPLTPLENWLRHRAGEAGYAGGFVEHYLLSALYPQGLTRRHQIALGVIVLAVNALIYWRVFSRSR